MNPYFKQLLTKSGLSWDDLAPYFHPQQVAAGKTLVQAGEVANTIYFINTGALRLWYNDDGRDISVQFFFENQMVAAYQSLITQQPSSLSLVTFAPSELMTLAADDLLQLRQRYPQLDQVIMSQLSTRFIDYMAYFLVRIKDSPEQRVQSILTNEPELFERVPKQDIASYLGITPVSLSRILKRLT